MTRSDWLLVYFALKGAPSGLDPVRIQKGMFLLSQEGGLPAEQTYDFRAYHYGPMSSAVYNDLEYLEATGLIEGTPVPGYSWQRYKATTRGVEEARTLLHEQADSAAAHKLYEIKQDVASKNFNDLLRDVYARYPAYATQSVFTG
jgi:uncharacterized protein